MASKRRKGEGEYLEAEVERLREKLKQEEAVRRLLEEEIRRLQEEVDRLTVAGSGFFHRLLWLMGC